MRRWILQIIFGLPGGALVLCPAAPAQPHASSKETVSPLFSQHGTLVVAVLDTNQIVIAIDSRLTSGVIGQSNQVQDGVEKVVQLSPQVAFFFTGAGVFGTSVSTNSLNDTAKTLAAEWRRDKRPIQLGRFAHEFRARAAKDLSRLTTGQIQLLHSAALQQGSSNVFQAVIAGQDFDAAFKLFRVTCSAAVEANGEHTNAVLSFDVSEEKKVEKQRFLFFGATKVFDQAMNDPKAPLAPMLREVRTSNALLAEPTAAGLVEAGVRQQCDLPDSPVGYPIFVYVLDADGFRTSRKVNKGERVTFDPREQGK